MSTMRWTSDVRQTDKDKQAKTNRKNVTIFARGYATRETDRHTNRKTVRQIDR